MSTDVTDLSSWRRNYDKGSLRRSDLLTNPFEQFTEWFEAANNSPQLEANAMVLATSIDNQPSQRVVLLKEFSKDGGFVFYTNYNSKKGRDLEQNPKASILFYWDLLERQIRIQGVVERVPREKSVNYFESRPAESRRAAIASDQSNRIPNKVHLENLLNNTDNLDLPVHWGGFTLQPNYFEFWQGGENRLHDRFSYELQPDASWEIHRLAP